MFNFCDVNRFDWIRLMVFVKTPMKWFDGNRPVLNELWDHGGFNAAILNMFDPKLKVVFFIFFIQLDYFNTLKIIF